MAVMNDSDMIPIPINEFIKGVTIPVDVYVRLSESRFILIARSGTRPPKDQLTTFKTKTVDYLWVPKVQYHKIAIQNIAIAGVMVTKDSLSGKQKTTVVTAAAKTVFNEFEHFGLNVETFNHARQVTEATVALVESHKDLSAIFESLNECNDGLLKHSMAVSSLSVLIAQNMGWENKSTLEKLSLGGLLHDLGKKALPAELLSKPKAMMSREEIQTYETHSFKGMQMLLSIGIVPDDVVSVVYEHHENAIGQGYPQRLRNLKMHPLAKVVALANEFCNLIMPNINCPVAKNPRDALMYIEHTMGQPFDKESFRALTSLILKDEQQQKVS